MPSQHYARYSQTEPGTSTSALELQTSAGTQNELATAGLLSVSRGTIIDDADLSNWSVDSAFPATTLSAGADGTRWFPQSIAIGGPTSSSSTDYGMERDVSVGAITDLTLPIHVLLHVYFAGVTLSPPRNAIQVTLWHDHSGSPNDYSVFTADSSNYQCVGFTPFVIIPDWVNHSGSLQDGTDSERGYCPKQVTSSPVLMARGSAGHWQPGQGISRINITLVGHASSNGPVTYGGMLHGWRVTPSVAFCMDDARINVLSTTYPSFVGADANKVGKNAYQYLKEKGMAATIGVIREDSESGGYLDNDDLVSLDADGFEICPHGASALTTSPFSDADDAFDGTGVVGGSNQTDGVLWNREYTSTISSRGAGTYIYPTNNYRSAQAAYQQQLWSRFDSESFRIARTSWPGWFMFPIGEWVDAKPSWYAFPGMDMETGSGDSSTTDMYPTHGALKIGLQQLIYAGGAAALQLHNLTARNAVPSDSDTPATGATTMYIEDLFEIIDWLADREDEIKVLTLGELRDQYSSLGV